MKKEVARGLLEIGAVFIRPDEPFTWASGIKSPIYCDNRLILTSTEVRTLVEEAMAKAIGEHFPETELLMGTATAGIAHAAICAHLLNLPMGYVRSGSKDHGRENKIEGKVGRGDKTLVIEDLISTGGSAIEAAEALSEAGADVLGILSIFTYGMAKGIEGMEKAGLRLFSLTDFDTLAEVAAEEGYIPREDIKRLLAFRDNPSDESWMGKDAL